MTDPDGSEKPARGKSVLVVDDNELVLNLLVHILENAGIEVLSADTGPAALDLFRDNVATIGCVLQDLVMPGMHGEEVIAEMKILDPEVRIIVLSAYDEARVRASLQNQVVAGFLRKPFVPADLVAQVRALLRRD